MNALLERLGSLAARRHWVIIIAWVIILGGLLAAKNAFGGEYVNNYTCRAVIRRPALTC